MKIIIRAFKGLVRYSLAVNNLGFLNTLKLIIFRKILSSNKINKIYSKNFGEIYWRPQVDFGVISHFFQPGIGFEFNDKIKTIIDVGANIGIESIRFRKFFPSAKIISIEANKENYEILEKNFKNDQNTIPLNIALWNKKTKLKLDKFSELNSEGFSYKELDDLDSQKNYDLTNSDIMANIINSYKLSEIDILKLDIEGAEKYIFDSSADLWINKINSIIMEVDKHNPFVTKIIFKIFERNKLSFKTFINGENIILIKKNFNLNIYKKKFY